MPDPLMVLPPSVAQARRFVLATAGVDPDPSRPGAAIPTDGALDWPAVIAFSHAEGALPQLAALSRAGHLPGMPDPLRVQLDILDRLHALRSGMVEDRARTLAGALEDAGIPFLFLKGAALASTVYPRFSDRAMGDLDVLVPGDRSLDALEVARAAGWVDSDNAPADSFFEAHQHLRPLNDGSGLDIGLDLHVHILPSHAPFSLTPDQIWASAVPASAVAPPTRTVSESARGDPLAARIPAPEFLLLHVCLHFAWSHTFSGGAWKAFRDIHTLLLSARIDPALFAKLAQRTRAMGTVQWTLWMAATLGGVRAAEVFGQAMPGYPAGWRARVLGRHLQAVASGTLPHGVPLSVTRRLWACALRPDSEGHAAARPWDRDGEFAAAGVSVTGCDHRSDRSARGPLQRISATALHLYAILRGR